MPEPQPVPPVVVCLDECPTDGPVPNNFDGIPEVEVFDRTAGEWRRLPHFTQGSGYSLEDPEKYVDPSSGTLQVRFINDRSDGVNFGFSVALEGTIR